MFDENSNELKSNLMVFRTVFIVGSSDIILAYKRFGVLFGSVCSWSDLRQQGTVSSWM